MKYAAHALKARFATVALMFLVSACVIGQAHKTDPAPATGEAGKDDGAKATKAGGTTTVKSKGAVGNPAAKSAKKPAVAQKPTGKAPAKTAAAPAPAPAVAQAPVEKAESKPLATAALAAATERTVHVAMTKSMPRPLPEGQESKPSPKAEVAKAETAKPAPAKTEVAKAEVAKAEPRPAPAPAPVKKAAPRGGRFVAVDVLNVRTSPNADAPVVAKLARGSFFTVTLMGDWAKLGEDQFVQTRYLSKTFPESRRRAVALGR